jgi:hypothetical protein
MEFLRNLWYCTLMHHIKNARIIKELDTSFYSVYMYVCVCVCVSYSSMGFIVITQFRIIIPTNCRALICYMNVKSYSKSGMSEQSFV